MVKLQIEDIVIRYKSVLDLHEKIQRALNKIYTKKSKIEKEMQRLKRKEKTLKKFLGFKENNADRAPYAIETVNS
jgi:hypothetical protein